MENQNKEWALGKFKVLEDNRGLFQITVGMLLAAIGLDEGVDDFMKLKWYAQVAECITSGETTSVTDDEKEEFIKLHLQLMGWNKVK